LIKDVEDSRVFSGFSMAENSNKLQILGWEGKINWACVCYLVWKFMLEPMAQPY
jgi:hypothetical protein